MDPAERLDADLRRLREGARTIVEAYATRAADREGRLTLAEVCAQLDLDESTVRERAAHLRERA